MLGHAIVKLYTQQRGSKMINTIVELSKLTVWSSEDDKSALLATAKVDLASGVITAKQYNYVLKRVVEVKTVTTSLWGE